jgi:hypothetical protein
MEIERRRTSATKREPLPGGGPAGGGHVADERLTEVGSVARQGRRLPTYKRRLR